MEAKKRLTTSAMRCYRRCVRLFKYKYIDGWRSTGPEADNLRYGSLIHLGLMVWFLSGMILEEVLKEIAGRGIDEYEQARAEEVLRGYHYRWKDAGLETIGAEMQFETPLVNPETGAASRIYVLAGKVDALARDKDGRICLVEHKTTSEDISTGSTYWQRLLMDDQIAAYYLGAAELGYEVDYCLYDVIAKPGLRPLKATPEEKRKYKKDGELYAKQRDRDETPDEYRARIRELIAGDPERFYQRGEVVRFQSEIDDYRADTWQLAKMIRENERFDRAPRNPGACFDWSRQCSFFDVCCGTEKLEHNQKFLKTDNVNPELSAG